ncbi:hypothetical protein [Aeromicrobium sp. UC242_57]|uniref:hypothetical protein n=1 Tax=Aeromicrobium sp. UC242_57 TaxID=3374624 RepID=UPI0037A4B0CA
MTQPYIASVDDEGETAMLLFSGTFSHAIRKGPLLAAGEGVRQDRDSREAITPRTPTPAQREPSQHVLDVTRSLLGLAAPPLYARVDLLTAADGSPVLIELQPPSRACSCRSPAVAAERFVDAVLALV